MRLPEEPDIPPQINIIPMIDVIFALLTFFIMSSLYLTRLAGLPVNLPSATTAETQSADQIAITLDAQGQLSLNRRPVRLEELQAQIRTLMNSAPTAIVVINADERISHGQVIAVMDQVRQIPGARLAISAKRPNQ
jgi:biopolymer transport protein ExbD